MASPLTSFPSGIPPCSRRVGASQLLEGEVGKYSSFEALAQRTPPLDPDRFFSGTQRVPRSQGLSPKRSLCMECGKVPPRLHPPPFRRYPMDLRVSGKDLIQNHLTMCLYGQTPWRSPSGRDFHDPQQIMSHPNSMGYKL